MSESHDALRLAPRHIRRVVFAQRAREQANRVQQNGCRNCGAQAGKWCKPDYGCLESDRCLPRP